MKYIVSIFLIFLLLTAFIAFTDILLTDYFFVMAVVFLGISTIMFILGRFELRKYLFKNQSSSKKKFRQNENIAFYLFFISIILFFISYLLA